ncbi:UDP-glycosyltransferase 91A1-like [Prosopis cineraria]|uniref:UDP-glycosyltransferase 91A1-like n=1 Tax=Prosopis cineraria TaxID=364024 RepID=UPI0024105632|nr:UDP-glycosyltransferase 91A1-like [Prosopis cineraria]
MSTQHEKLHIALFPWLAFGHLIPNLELAKLLAQKGHVVTFISTPRNILRLPKLPPHLSPNINFLKLPLPQVPNLPDDAEATSDVPYNVVQYLKLAYDTLQQPVTCFLESSNPDWIFYDFVPYWVGSIASKLGIKSAYFSIFNASLLGFLGPAPVLMGQESVRTKPEDFTIKPSWVPFSSTVAWRYFEIMKISDGIKHNDSGVSDLYRFGASIENCDIVVIRSCSEFEPEWLRVLEEIHRKPILPVGQLPNTNQNSDAEDKNDMWRLIKDWLDQKDKGTVVYVAFGSEAKPSQAEVNEIALGLEKSELPFCWALRTRRGPTDTEVLSLPEGFEERTKGRGLVCTGWAPQLNILGHDSVGGFLTHSGWSSVVEAVQEEKPLVLLTFLADQGINARVLEEKKMGYSIPRDERDGSFTSDSVANSLRLVMVQPQGRVYRENIKEMKDLLVNKERQDRSVDGLLDYLKAHRKSGTHNMTCY